MLPKFINRTKIPHKPGVYIYKNKSGQVIYVGKAIDLYHRVASYFSGYSPGVKLIHPPGGQSIKTAVLVENIASIETIIVESELEALILEANLIKKYLPEFNVSLKDDKGYLYIIFTKEEFPRVLTARKQDLGSVLKHFGPFPSSRTVKETLKSLRKVFPWCSQPPRRRLARLKACFYLHIGLCPGACIGLISKEDYMKIIRRLIRFLNGDIEKLVADLTKEMIKASKDQKFEEAARVKKTLIGIAYLTQTNRTEKYLENPNFLEDLKQIALHELQRVLNLSKLPERIECYDISNIQGHESTGSMVVLTHGEIDKSQYRKFKIKMTGKPNDVGMHMEMMRRRLKHPEWFIPDLMIIDGGLGQVRGVNEVLMLKRHPELVSGSRKEMPELVRHDEVIIPIFGLAKRFEWLYSPDGEIIKLPKRSEALKMVQKIRDEAHRFAITYHRKLHSRVVMDKLE